MTKLSKAKIKARNQFRKEVIDYILKHEILIASNGMLESYFPNNSSEYYRSYYNWLNNMVEDEILNKTNNIYRLSSNYENKFYSTFWTKFVDLFFTSIKGFSLFILNLATFIVTIFELIEFFKKTFNILN